MIISWSCGYDTAKSGRGTKIIDDYSLHLHFYPEDGPVCFSKMKVPTFRLYRVIAQQTAEIIYVFLA
jgi:hypothetical protein